MAMTCPLVALVTLAACRTMQAEVDTPAVVVRPTPESRAAVAQAVRTALEGRPVTLADDALTDDGVLVIERTWVRDPSGSPLNGRDLGVAEPERFHLVKSGDRCILVHDRTNRRVALIGTACAPR
jgi:hypothetical protein